MLLILGLAVHLRGDLTGHHSHHGGAGELTGTLSFSQLKLTTTTTIDSNVSFKQLHLRGCACSRGSDSNWLKLIQYISRSHILSRLERHRTSATWTLCTIYQHTHGMSENSKVYFHTSITSLLQPVSKEFNIKYFLSLNRLRLSCLPLVEAKPGVIIYRLSKKHQFLLKIKNL